MAGTDHNYFSILEILKEKIRLARQKATIAVNTQLLSLYWEIGNTITQHQKQEGWGAKVIDKLAADLKTEFPDFKGLSPRNLRYMKSFAEAWPGFSILQPPVAKLQDAESYTSTILQPLVAQIPWAHHIVILNKVKPPKDRIFYIEKTVENGWSKSVLALQIESQFHLRQGNAITNFEHTLPKPQSDLAKEALKNPYIFDFLGIGEEMQERELEKALIQHIKKFMLELGRGFAYVGNQYNLNVEDDDYFLDMLFYNYHLHCFVVFELKVGNFKPEFTGKLNFYINTVNEQIKGNEDKPTIGVLLCKTPNDTVVKYSLQGINTPMGVAEYEFTNALPKQLKGEMPSIEELEQELEKEMEILRKPIDEKKNKLKEILGRIKNDEVQKEKEKKDIIDLFEKVLLPLKQETENLLKEEINLFTKKEFTIWVNNTGYENLMLPDLEARFLKNENIYRLQLSISLEGFKKAGVKTFGVSSDLLFTLENFKYQVGPNKGTAWYEYLYHHQWTEEEIEQTAERWSELILDEINRQAEQVI